MMINRLRHGLVLLAAVVFPFAGCDSAADNSSVQNDLANSLWLFSGADTPDGVVGPAAEGQQATIEFGGRATDGEAFLVSGYNGCNLFSGRFEAAGETLRFSDLVQSYRACTEAEGRLESLFMQVLNDEARFTLDGDALTIENLSRGIRLHLIRG